MEEDLQTMSKTKSVELANACDIETKSTTKDELIGVLRKFLSAPSKVFNDVVEITEKLEAGEQSLPTLTAEFDLGNCVVLG